MFMERDPMQEDIAEGFLNMRDRLNAVQQQLSDVERSSTEILTRVNDIEKQMDALVRESNRRDAAMSR